MTDPEYTRIRYEVDGPVATITLARPEVANAQDFPLLGELNRAMDRAAHDTRVKVIVLGADGRHFSSGHDLSALGEHPPQPFAGTAVDFDAPGIEGYIDVEREAYLGYAKRWREIPKPTIARVQGKVIAGGLVLMWPMDLIVCSDNATFCDPVVALGSNGIEYFAHPSEVGARTAKDMLFTGRTLTAHEARQLGMVQRIFAADALVEETHTLAQAIAEQPSFALKMAKQSVNFAQDAAGYTQSLEAAFAMHQVLHAHWMKQEDGLAIAEAGALVPGIVKAPPPPGTWGAERAAAANAAAGVADD